MQSPVVGICQEYLSLSLEAEMVKIITQRLFPFCLPGSSMLYALLRNVETMDGGLERAWVVLPTALPPSWFMDFHFLWKSNGMTIKPTCIPIIFHVGIT